MPTTPPGANEGTRTAEPRSALAMSDELTKDETVQHLVTDPPGDEPMIPGPRTELTADGPQARRDETAALFERIASSSDPDERHRLREQIVVLNLPVATSIALRYRGRGEPVEDLVQVAHLGLVKAVDGFDASRGSDFLAYAVPTVRGEVKRYFRDRGWDIRPPRRVQELRARVEQATELLAQQLDRSPRPTEIAQHLGVDVGDVIECLASAECYHVHSLDAPTDADDGIDLAGSVGTLDPELARVEDMLSVRPLLAQLPPRDRRILALRFYRGWTQSQIAEDVGVTQMQVSRLISQALKRLRAQLEVA
jgi:RNA polymerase sigma-B factor